MRAKRAAQKIERKRSQTYTARKTATNEQKRSDTQSAWAEAVQKAKQDAAKRARR